MRSLLDKIGIFTDKIPDHSIPEFDFLPHYTGIEKNIDISAASNLQNETERPQSNNDETIQRFFFFHIRHTLFWTYTGMDHNLFSDYDSFTPPPPP